MTDNRLDPWFFPIQIPLYAVQFSLSYFFGFHSRASRWASAIWAGVMRLATSSRGRNRKSVMYVTSDQLLHAHFKVTDKGPISGHGKDQVQ